MTHHVFLLLLLCVLLFSVARLCFLCWPHHGPVRLTAAKRSTLQRLLKPRSPDDCPACRHASPASSAGVPTPAPVRPWSEVKSRRGAPKRINTAGFACPNPQCRYFGNTDGQIHAAFRGWQAWACRADPDLSLSSLPYHVHFQAQHAPLPAENALAAGRHGTHCVG